MGGIMITRIKICCIADREEAALAVRCGASAIGLVSAMPSGPGPISEDRIAEIAASVPPGVSTFLLTSRQDTASIIAQQKRCGVDTIQICDSLAEGSYAELHAQMPGVKIVQVIHVLGEEAIAEALRAAPQVDAILLDSGNPLRAVKELGGTGRAHDWEVSRRLREAVATPIFLAGGLSAENVGRAVSRVRPFAVDVCTGVRTDGRLDEEKLLAFVQAVRTADSELPPT
jgi:phosphoribosylanthranilate isomerase